MGAANENVTLLVPYLASEDQHTLFPQGLTFTGPKQQEQYTLSQLAAAEQPPRVNDQLTDES